MADRSHRTSLGDNSRPRKADPTRETDHLKVNSRRLKDRTDKDKTRSGRIERSRRTKAAILELNVIGQTSSVIYLGTSVKSAVLVSLKLSSASHFDASGLLAAVSLVKDDVDGQHEVMEGGSLTSQKMVDSIHPIPEEVAPVLASSDPHRMALGYFSFPDLMIKQTGTYRIRTTLIKVVDAEVLSLCALDSEPIVVKRYHRSSQPHLHKAFA